MELTYIGLYITVVLAYGTVVGVSSYINHIIYKKKLKEAEAASDRLLKSLSNMKETYDVEFDESLLAPNKPKKKTH